MSDAAGHYRAQMIRYAEALDHVLALASGWPRDLELHDPSDGCTTCDWIRIRPARAYASLQEAEAALAELRLPRKEPRA